MLPSFSSMLKAETRHHMNVELTKLSGLLAIYRAENGEYPSQLEQLVPNTRRKSPKILRLAGRLSFEKLMTLSCYMVPEKMAKTTAVH
jgi:hypothetical protein